MEQPMRAIWKGAVSFGLVSVPVKLYSATESHDISFRQVHAKDGGRIKYQRVCSIDGEEVAYADIAKGYETEDGQMVVLDDDDLAELPASSSREISVEKFVPSDQIDPMWLEKSYYLEPDKAAAKPYALLREALKEADRVAVVTVSIRTRMTTAVLRVRDDVIVMQTMLWPDEVRKPDFAGLDATEHAAKPNELKMAKLLVDTLAGDYDAGDYEDDYQKAVEALVQAKLEGGEVQAPEQPKKSTGEVVDLLAALQRSVDAAKTSRGEPAAPADETDAVGSEKTADKAPATSTTSARKSGAEKPGAEKAGTKKAGTKKPAAKKPAAKKPAAKRSAGEKPAAKKSTTKKSAAKKTADQKAS
jgi:DNA end-binding protein Ku